MLNVYSKKSYNWMENMMSSISSMGLLVSVVNQHKLSLPKRATTTLRSCAPRKGTFYHFQQELLTSKLRIHSKARLNWWIMLSNQEIIRLNIDDTVIKKVILGHCHRLIKTKAFSRYVWRQSQDRRQLSKNTRCIGKTRRFQWKRNVTTKKMKTKRRQRMLVMKRHQRSRSDPCLLHIRSQVKFIFSKIQIIIQYCSHIIRQIHQESKGSSLKDKLLSNINMKEL